MMLISRILTWLYLVGFLTLQWSCQPPSDKNSSRLDKKNSQEEPDVTVKKEHSVSVQEDEKIDPLKLWSRDPILFISDRGRLPLLILKANVAKDAAYIEYSLCPKSYTGGDQECEKQRQDDQSIQCSAGGACVKGTSDMLQVSFPMVVSGEVEVSVKACTTPEAAISSVSGAGLCGPAAKASKQLTHFDPKVAGLYFDLEQTKSNLINLVSDYKKDFQVFAEEAAKCDLQSARAKQFLDQKVRVAHSVNAIPKQIFVTAMDTAVGEELTSELSTFAKQTLSKTGSAIADGCEQFGEATNQAFCQVLGTGSQVIVGMLTLINPAPTVGELSHNIHNIVAADQGDFGKISPRMCTAPQNLLLKKETWSQQNAQQIKRYRELKAQLKKLGYEPVVGIR